MRRGRSLAIALALALVISIVGVAAPAMATLYLQPGIASGNGVVPTVVGDFAGCAEGLTAYTWDGKKAGTQVTPEGLSITVSPTNQNLPGRDDRYFDFSVDGGEISQVVVLTEVFIIGWITESNLYDYPEAVSGDTKLHPPADWRDRPFKIDGVRFCYEPTVDISGVVYHDLDADGAKDGDDSGLSGEQWTVTATNGDALYSAEPGEGGSYSFDDLPPGSYEVCQDSPEGWIQSEPASDGCYDVSSNTSDADFGKYQNATISGSVLVDTNGDGSLVGDSAGVEGSTVGADGFSDTTDTDGTYIIEGVKPGTYDVCQTPPGEEGWIQSVPSDDGCFEVIVESGGSVEGGDFGVYQQGGITGMRLIGGEAFPFQTVRLLGGEGGSTETALDGSFEFTPLDPGEYTVCTPDLDGTTAPDPMGECSEGEVGTAVDVTSGFTVSGIVFNDEVDEGEEPALLTCGETTELVGDGVSGSVSLFCDEGGKVVLFQTDPAPDTAINEVSFDTVGEASATGETIEHWTFDPVILSDQADWRLYYDDGMGERVALICDLGGGIPAGETTCVIEANYALTETGLRVEVTLKSEGDPSRGFR